MYGWYSLEMENELRRYYNKSIPAFLYTTPNGNKIKVTTVGHDPNNSGYHPSVTDAIFMGPVVKFVGHIH